MIICMKTLVHFRDTHRRDIIAGQGVFIFDTDTSTLEPEEHILLPIREVSFKFVLSSQEKTC